MIIAQNGILSEDFVSMQESLKPDIAIEVGAHAAEFSVEMAKRFGVKAIAFEANTVVYNRHKHNNSDLVSYLNYAVSDRDGIVYLNVHEDMLAGNNSIKQRANHQNIATIEVQAYRLDTYFADYDFANACLWIDVEGANREVLTGAIETLKRCSSIFIETEDFSYWEDQWLTNDVISFLEEQGFQVLGSERVYEKQKNIIFVKKEQ